MNLITKAFNKIFKSGNQQELDKIKPLIDEINKQESSISILKDNEFKERSITIKNLLAIKGENNQFKIQIENLIDEIKKLI